MVKLFGRSKKRSKVVSVHYGAILNKPSQKNIEKAIDKWMREGYRLVNQENRDPSTSTKIFSWGLARGVTILTFVLEETEDE